MSGAAGRAASRGRWRLPGKAARSAAFRTALRRAAAGDRPAKGRFPAAARRPRNRGRPQRRPSPSRRAPFLPRDIARADPAPRRPRGGRPDPRRAGDDTSPSRRGGNRPRPSPAAYRRLLHAGLPGGRFSGRCWPAGLKSACQLLVPGVAPPPGPPASASGRRRPDRRPGHPDAAARFAGSCPPRAFRPGDGRPPGRTALPARPVPADGGCSSARASSRQRHRRSRTAASRLDPLCPAVTATRACRVACDGYPRLPGRAWLRTWRQTNGLSDPVCRRSPDARASAGAGRRRLLFGPDAQPAAPPPFPDRRFPPRPALSRCDGHSRLPGRL